MSNNASTLPPIDVSCPNCKRLLELEGKVYDKPKRLVECPNCKTQFEMDIPPKYLKGAKGNIVVGFAALALLAWGLWWATSKIFGGESSAVKICDCLNNASYYNNRESACDKKISAYLGHDWKTSTDPDDTEKMKDACR